MNLLISLRSEILKTKRTATFYLTFIMAALIPVIFLMDVISDGMSPENKANALNALFREGFGGLCVMVLPTFAILATTMLPQIEFRNNTWKQVFASPQTMGSIFFARFLNIQLLILLFLLVFNLFMALTAVITHFIYPSMDLLHMPFNKRAWLNNNWNSYIGSLAVSTLQFWIGLRLRNFIVPIAVGFSMWFVGMLLVMEMQSGITRYFPYSFLLYNVFDKLRPMLPTVLWTSVICMLVFLGLGFWDFQRRRVK
jgi:lantibiotic transport system permease protein